MMHREELVSQTDGKFKRAAMFAYGAAMYALFVVTFGYAIGFVSNALVPKSIDVGGPTTSVPTALLINAGLLSLFVLQHTVMARRRFKHWWTRFIPQAIERSTFVLATCVVLGLIFWQWRPMPGVVWRIDQPALRALLHTLSAAGWLLVLYSSFLIDHFELFGLRQVVEALRGRAHRHPRFVTPWLYRLVRNPLMLGFIVAFWATPDMTIGHLQFAAMTTGYIFFGVWMEERTLLGTLGEDYRQYRARTPMLVPRIRSRVAPQVGPSVLPRTSTPGR
jgi:protein-S-isoprenylcysteine O-methyltransferase Ste14